MNIKVTVFTPAYNRGYLLSRLYNSLLDQTDKDFEWIIVDDGSSDNTNETVLSFINDGKISINYIYQQNQGKHVAINSGVQYSKEGLFLIVDSDDYISSDAVSLIKEKWKEVVKSGRRDFGGIVFNKSDLNGKMVGSPIFYDTLDASYFDYRFKHKISGDKTEVFLTKVLKEFPFPKFGNERFCPEALIWNRIATRYILRYYNVSIYFCEYLEGGLTDNIVKVRMNNPIASITYYAELANHKSLDLKEKVKAIINYWRFAYYLDNMALYPKIKKLGIFWGISLLPIAYFLILKDKKNVAG